MNDTLSTQEAARLLGISVQTVQRWVDLGRLRAWKTVGGHRRIEAPSVAELLRERGVVMPVQAAAAGGTPASVMIVDDDDGSRELLLRLARAALPGALVSAVSNGFAALLAIGQATPDALVMDVMMPNMNGFEMLRHIADEGMRQPGRILAVSSYSLEELARFGRLPDGVAFQGKPIEPDRFIGYLQRPAG
jgi:excisionase family DNA binding protein